MFFVEKSNRGGIDGLYMGQWGPTISKPTRRNVCVKWSSTCYEHLLRCLYMDVKGKFTDETLFFLGLDCVFVFTWVEAEEFQVALFWWKLQGNLFIDLFFC